MINSIDTSITGYIFNLFPHNQLIDSIFTFFSLYGNSLILWILIILITLIIEEVHHPGIQKRDRLFIFYFLLSFALTGFIVNLGLKNIFRRPRPCQLISTDFNPLRQSASEASLSQLTSDSICPPDYSFPSGHAATAFTASTVLSYFDRKRRWFYYLIALLIALSRIYLLVHYFSDVVVGGLIGSFISKMVLLIKYPIKFKVLTDK